MPGSTSSVTYDPEADVLYVRLSDDAVQRSTFLDDLRVIDYSADGGVVGIEFISASDGIDLRDIPFAETVERLIRESGNRFPVFA